MSVTSISEEPRAGSDEENRSVPDHTDLVLEVNRLYRQCYPDLEPEAVDVDLKGHLCGVGPSGDPLPINFFDRSRVFTLQRISDADLLRLKMALQTKTLPLEKPADLELSALCRCCHCEQEQYQFDGLKLLSENPCPYPHGFEIEFDIAILSGKMMISDDFRPWFSVPGEGGINVNSVSGTGEMTVEAASNGFAHFAVGNSCPSLFRAGDTYSVACLALDDDEKPMDAEARHYQEQATQLTVVDTELWWVTIADAEDFRTRGCQAPADEICVEPGTYRFRYYSTRKDFDHSYDRTLTFADFRRVDDDPLPPRLIATTPTTAR